jgi:protein-tyrosine phosphatase
MKSEIYWIDGPWPGRLAIMPRPRSGDWLEDEIKAWHRAGIEVVVSLLDDEEVEELNLADEPQLAMRAGIEFVTFPIRDREVPDSRRSTLELLRRLDSDLTAGRRVALHCRAGIGRSAIIAAALLALAGMDVGAAFHAITRARGCPLPDTREQREWVEQFVRDTATPTR